MAKEQRRANGAPVLMIDDIDDQDFFQDVVELLILANMMSSVWLVL
jgi:hypothetical protein